MITCWILALAAALVVPEAATAQHGSGPGGLTTVAPREASQFDFLVGQWELTVRVPSPGGLAARIHGTPRLAGTWKAWRGLDGWGVEDELRIADGSGNPLSLTHALRVFDATARGWTSTTLDIYRARVTQGTGAWRDGQMLVTAQGTDAEGHAYVSRGRYYDITPDGFKFQQDRSLDGGRTWTEGAVRIEAKRVAAVAPR